MASASGESSAFVRLSNDEYNKLDDEARKEYDRKLKAAEEEEQARLPYKWSQTLQDVTVTFPLEKGLRARDCDIKIQRRSLKAGIKGKEPIINGELCKEVKVDDSTWTVVDGEVRIELQKVNGQEWWKNVIVGHPERDTTKMEPENSRLEDLDGETRAMVEKMMFDQRQKAMGKPTSDEMKKMEAFEQFKQMHPEMDFSQAKLS